MSTMRAPALLRTAIVFGAETIPYEVRFVAGRTTLAIEVHPDLMVRVRAPAGCAPELIHARVSRRAAWISKQLANFGRYTPKTPPRQYVSGETHLYLGRQYRLKVVVSKTMDDVVGVKMGRGQLVVALPESASDESASASRPERVKALLNDWYLAKARGVFDDVIAESMPRFRGHAQPRLTLRAMQTRWGSLSPAGLMTLNATLIRAPRVCIEYVVAHELCHLKYRDHDARFFRLLSNVMPDWEKRKARLETVLL